MVKLEPIQCGKYIIKVADTNEEKDQLYRLRYEDLLLHFNRNNVNEEKTFIDSYDPLCDHLICYDTESKEVAGTYRLVMQEHIKSIGSFITEFEYDLTKLKSDNILELGRAVVKEQYRDGSVILMLWRGIINYATNNNIKYMFGTGSFHGTNIEDYAHALSCIYYNHLSPEEVRVTALDDSKQNINLIDKENIDLTKAKEQMPALIKGYIKLGATFGEDAYIDRPFNSIDVFVLLDVDKVNPIMLKRLLK